MPYELMSDSPAEPESESVISQAGRGIVRTASRVGEQVAGFPGDIMSLVNEYIAKPVVEYATGEKGVSYDQTPLGKMLPTSETHRKNMEKGLGNILKPQNDVEKYIDNIVQEATSYTIPGLRQAKVLDKAVKSLVINTTANALGDITKDWTKDEKKAGYVKAGSLLLLSLFDKPAAAKTVGDLYKPLQDKVVNLNPVNATGLSANLNNLKNRMLKGTQAPSEKFVVDEIDAILGKIKNGTITPEELWATKRSLNEKLTKVLFETPRKADQGRARKLAKTITHDLDQTMKQTVKQDPKFYKDLKKADQAFGVINESNLITKYIENNMKYNPVTHGLVNMFQSSVGSLGAGAILPYQVGKILYRITHSPVLAKHYGNVLKAAATENAITLNKELKKLDQGLQKETKKDKFILMD
jgi:hypothetical protein